MAENDDLIMPWYTRLERQDTENMLGDIGITAKNDADLFVRLCEFSQENMSPVIDVEMFTQETARWAISKNVQTMRHPQNILIMLTQLSRSLQEKKLANPVKKDGRLDKLILTYYPEY